MKNTITTDEARGLLHKYLQTDHLLKHSRESEVIMRALAKHFGEDEELWGVTGLLHDLDLDELGENYETHGQRTCEILESEGYHIPEMFQAIKSHTEELGFLGVKRDSKLDFCLAAAENTTGLISAYVLVRPDKSIAGAKVKSLNKKFKDKAFAAKVSRTMINDIEKTGLARAEFFGIAIESVKEIADEVGM